jgi:3-keto-disaccharide hydrolase
MALFVLLLLPALVAQDGFVDLLATDDLSDWVEEYHPRERARAAQENLKAFSIKDGVLHCDGSVGNVGFIRHKEEYCDFDLRIEFRAPAGTTPVQISPSQQIQPLIPLQIPL